MDFVDDFRYYKEAAAIEKPFEINDEKKDAVLAGTIETLCDELSLSIPGWLENVPACREPCFLSRVEAMKTFSLVESPPHFRARNVFVGDNFLFRV